MLNSPHMRRSGTVETMKTSPSRGYSVTCKECKSAGSAPFTTIAFGTDFRHCLEVAIGMAIRSAGCASAQLRGIYVIHVIYATFVIYSRCSDPIALERNSHGPP